MPGLRRDGVQSGMGGISIGARHARRDDVAGLGSHMLALFRRVGRCLDATTGMHRGFGLHLRRGLPK
jgi:hypothetical protein